MFFIFLKEGSKNCYYINMRKNQHVIPYTKNNGKKAWAIKTSNSIRVTKVFDHQDKAISLAQKRAKKDGVELFIHGKDGRIRERNNYE